MKPLMEMVLPGERVWTFVGAGGKTTLIDALAGQLSGWGARVLVTTTTKMYPPGRNFMLLDSPRVPPYRRLTVARRVDPATGKMEGVGPDEIPGLMERFQPDYLLVEADGAAGRPVKAPLEHEPVIPAWSDVVVGVIGLDCLGAAVSPETVFRMEAFCRITGLEPGQAVTPEALDALAAHPQGLFKGCPEGARRLAFHNKADAWPRVGRLFGSGRQGWFVSLE